jgi:hypothetical protein
MTDSIVVIIAVVVIFVILISQAWRRGQPSNTVITTIQGIDTESQKKIVDDFIYDYPQSPISEFINDNFSLSQNCVMILLCEEYVMPDGTMDWYTMLGVLQPKSREYMINLIEEFEKNTIANVAVMSEKTLATFRITKSEFFLTVFDLCNIMRKPFLQEEEYEFYQMDLNSIENKRYRYSNKYVEIIRKSLKAL